MCVSWCSAPSFSPVRDLRKRTHAMDSDFRRIHLAGELLSVTAPGEHAQPPLSLKPPRRRATCVFRLHRASSWYFSLEAEEKQTQLSVFLRSDPEEEEEEESGAERTGCRFN